MYFLIGVWGGPRRIYAAVKFILYTMAGSLLMLVAILALYFLHRQATGDATFNLFELLQLELPLSTQRWLFLAFFLAFAIKVPLFPFHTWLPDAHVEAPTAGSVILAGVLLKMGTYGFVRFCLPLFPEASLMPHHHRPAGGGRHHLWGLDGTGPNRHQEARGLFQRQPSRLRHAGDFCLQ